MSELRIHVTDPDRLPETFEEDFTKSLAQVLCVQVGEVPVRPVKPQRIGGKLVFLLVFTRGDVAVSAVAVAPALAAELGVSIAGGFISILLYEGLKWAVRQALEKLRNRGDYPELAAVEERVEANDEGMGVSPR